MKKINLIALILLCFTFLTVSCCCNHSSCSTGEIVMKDHGNNPMVFDIEAYTMENENFVFALWTGSNFQITLMSIPVGGEIGLEVHPDVDQFLRVEDGKATVMMGDCSTSLTFVETAYEDFAIIIPAGKWHNVINSGTKPLKLYSIYAPSEHSFGTVHKTQADAQAAHSHAH